MLDRRDVPASRRSRSTPRSDLQAFLRVADHRPLDRRPERTLGQGLGLADLAEHPAATSYTTGSPPAAARSSSSASGHVERWIEPSCHQDQTSSVTYGRKGANNRSSTRQGERSGGDRRPRGLGPVRAVRAALHELEVVVGEAPEEPLDRLERSRVLVVLERAGRLVHDVSESRRASSDRAGRPISASRRVEREREAGRVQDLDREPPAHLDLLLVEGRVDARAGRWLPSTGRHRPRAARGAPSASRRCPWTSTSSCGRGPGRSR